MKFVESISKEDFIPEKIEETYNRSGQLSQNKEKVFARYTEINLSKGEKQKRYFIMTCNNIPYDPYGIDSHREKNLRTSLKTVSKQTFDYYILYLKTRNLLYMTRTQRSFING
jgi:hypothetical protein